MSQRALCLPRCLPLRQVPPARWNSLIITASEHLAVTRLPRQVSTPQLDLLEQSLSTMGRVQVWAMMGGNRGTNLNVFYEAKLAWARRQSQIRAKIDAGAGGVGVGGGVGMGGGGVTGSGFGGGVAGLWERMRANAANMTEPAGAVRETASGKSSGGGWARASASASSARSDGGSAGRAAGAASASTAGTGPNVDTKAIGSLAAKAARATRLWRSHADALRRGRRRVAGALPSDASSSADAAD